MKNFKRFLSLALALLMIFSYAPTIAYGVDGAENYVEEQLDASDSSNESEDANEDEGADEGADEGEGEPDPLIDPLSETDPQTETPVAQIGDVSYETLADAIKEAKTGDTITFLADITEDVTISKAVTIDGADKTYTGAMTLKADTTIKNVNFDGKGYNGYAVETRGADYLTIEDCTAKNYGYGFVQLASGTALTTVKNVTVSNMNYGVKVDYSNAVVLENVDITAAVAAVLNSNYGEKTITIKNSKISILGTWTRNNTINTTYVFEGANTIDEFVIDAAIDNFELGEGAALTAPEGYTVTTKAAGYKVVYENGIYTAVEKSYVAKIGEQGYATLAEAIEKAQPGDTVVLLTDINLADCEIKTLDGKHKTYFLVEGKTITVDFKGKTISGAYTGDSMLVGVFSTDNGGHLTLTGNGTIDVTATNTVYGLLVNYESGCSITIENGTYELDKASDSLIYSGADETVTVEGGTFTLGNVGTGSNGSPWIFNAKGQNTANIIVNGGTFNADIIHQFYPFEVMAPKELALVEGPDGTWSFVDAVAYVNEQEWSSKWYTNEVGYATFEEAIAAVEAIRTKNGQNSPEEFITLLTDIKLTTVVANIDVPNVRIELNGYTLMLASKDATLMAAEGLNVTTNIDGKCVEYNVDEGVYEVAGPSVTITFTDSNTNSEVTLKYPSERFDTIQKLIGTNSYADFVLGAEQSELLAYIADGRASNIVMTLHDDIELDAPINFYNKYFQVDASGYELTIVGNGNTITWADGYNGTLLNVESGVSVELKNLTIDGENEFTFYNDTTTVENGQNWYTRFVDVGEEDKAVNANVIVNAGNLTLGEDTKIQNVTIASDGDNGKTSNTETGGYYLMYNDDLAIIKSNGGTVELSGAEITGNAGMVLNAVNATSSITGSTIKGNMGCGNKGGIIIANGGTMTITDSSICDNKAMARSATVLGVINGAEVTFNATMDNNKHIGVGSNTAGAMVVLEGASQFVMNGGSISNNVGGRAGAIASRWAEATAMIELNVGAITGNTASNDSWNGASIFLRSPATIGENMEVEGLIAVNAAPGELDITGGSFIGSLTVTDGLTAEITGGTFNYDPTEWLAEGYEAPENGNGTWTVSEMAPVAQVGDKEYYSLKKAIEACTNGETVKLLADITYGADDVVFAHGGATGFGNYDQYNPSIIYIGGTKGATPAENQPSNVNAVIDLNGHTITSDADAYMFLIMDNAQVTFTDSVGGGKVVNNSTNYPAIWSCGTDTLVTIKNGTYQTASPYGLIHSTHSADLVIEGGHFSTTANDASLLLMINSQKYNNPNYFLVGVATLTVKGGTFVGFNPEKVGDDYGASSIEDIKFVDGCALGYEAVENGDGTFGVVLNKLAKVEVEMIPGVWGTSYITVENWADLVAALGENTNLPVKVTLLEDIELTDEVLTIEGAAEKVIDLNGHKITGTVTKETTALVYVTGGCELTIKDSSEDMTGGIHAVNTNGNLSNLIRVETDAKMVIESGNFTQDASVNGAGMIDSRGDEIITIKGGNFRLDNIGSASNGSPWIFNASSQNTKNIIVTGGTFNADIFHQFYIFEVKDTTEVAELLGVPVKAAKDNGDGTWTVVDAAAYVDEQHKSGNWYTQNTGYATLEEAFAAAGKYANGDKGYTVTLVKDVNETVTVELGKAITLELNGKTFNGEIVLTAEDAALTAAEGLKVTSGKDDFGVIYEEGVYKLSDAVAQIGNNYYKTLKDAITAAKAGDTVVLLKDIKLDWDDTVAAADGKAVLINVEGKNITLDFNGKTIEVKHLDTAEANRIYAVVLVADGAGLTVTGDGEIDVTASNTTPRVAYLFWKRGTTGYLTIENGTYHMNTSEDSMVYTNGNEIVTIEGGTWTLDGYNNENGPWIFNVQGAGDNHVIVTGGTYNFDINRQKWSNEVLVPETYYTVANEDGTYTVNPGAVAYVNTGMLTGPYFAPKDIGYATIEEAFAAAVDYKDEEITLLKDVVLTDNVEISIPGIVLHHNGFALDCKGNKIFLTAEDATLAADKDLDVDTTVTNSIVVYEEGVYKVEIAAAKIGENLYATLDEALKAANSGDTVVLLRDVEESTVLVRDGITLNLDTFALTADYVIAFNGSYITAVRPIENGEYGRLIVPNKNRVSLCKDPYITDNGRYNLPVWDPENNYFVFSNINIITDMYSCGVTTSTDENGNSVLSLKFFPNADSYTKNILKDKTSAETGITFKVFIEWNGEKGRNDQSFFYSDDYINLLNKDSTQRLTFNLRNYDKLENLKVYVAVESATGVIALKEIKIN